MSIRKFISYILSVICLFLISCVDDIDKVEDTSHEVKTYRVAVFATQKMMADMQATAAWAQHILDRGQENMPVAVHLELVWLPEDEEQFGRSLSALEQTDRPFDAVIGPEDAQRASELLQLPVLEKTTVILPKVASSELQRVYAASNHVFFLTQSDVMQSELLLSMSNSFFYSKSITLVTTDDSYGSTFRQWFGFQASEKGLDVTTVEFLNEVSPEECVQHYVQRAQATEWNGREVEDKLFLVPSDAESLVRFDQELTKVYERARMPEHKAEYTRVPVMKVLCADRCVDYELGKQIRNEYYGVEPVASPESGFSTSYELHFGKPCSNGMPQLFDAVYMLTYALSMMNNDGTDDSSLLWQYIVKLIDGRESFNLGWSAADVEQTLQLLHQDYRLDMRGVSSNWDFDERYHSAPKGTTYRYWHLYGGKFSTMAYVSSYGSGHAMSSVDLWTVPTTVHYNLDDTGIQDVVYPELHDRYAVVVAASTGWENYRHQADALSMYHLLKRHGYDDEHIILIMEDDIAHNPKNKRQGDVRVEVDGENLYHDLQIDYKLTDLSYDDIICIVSGQQSDRLPVVLPSTVNDNVLFFWSGHGNPNTLYADKTKFTAPEVRRMLDTMYGNGKYRRLLFVIEACYSGSVAQGCEGVPGVLFLTAANGSETSKADVLDKSLPAYLSNGFTRGFQQRVDAEPDVTLRDLYYHLASQTVGSHASIYNVKAFGSVFKTRMGEFLR